MQAVIEKTKWLKEFRERNSKVFLEKPLKKSKYTNIPELDSFLEGTKKSEAEIKLFGGGKLFSLEEALEKFPREIENILKKEQKPKDQYEGFINSNFGQGFVVVIGKKDNNKTIKIEIGLKDKSVTKYFIIVKQGVKVNLIERLKSNGKVFCGRTVFIKEGSEVGHVKLNDLGKVSFLYEQLIVEKDASIENTDFWFKGKIVRGNKADVLNGEGARVKDYNILLSKNKEHFDLNFVSVHRAADSFSHCIFKAVLRDESKNVFDGMIIIEENASGTNALLECHSMILGDKASSNQIPGLEIKTDDVKVTHSATITRVDENELFYLGSKGISIEEAKKMAVEGFLESVVFKVSEELREPLMNEIEKNL